MVRYKNIVFLGLCLLLGHISQSQPGASINEDDLDALRPRVVRQLTIKDGLPTDCFSTMAIDMSGRMWLTSWW